MLELLGVRAVRKELETLPVLGPIRTGARTTEAAHHEASLAWRDDLRRSSLARRLPGLSGPAFVPGVRRVLYLLGLRSWIYVHVGGSVRRRRRLRRLHGRLDERRVWHLPVGHGMHALGGHASVPGAGGHRARLERRPPGHGNPGDRGRLRDDPRHAGRDDRGERNDGRALQRRLAVLWKRRQVHRWPLHRTEPALLGRDAMSGRGRVLRRWRVSSSVRRQRAPLPGRLCVRFQPRGLQREPQLLLAEHPVPGRRHLCRNAVRCPLRSPEAGAQCSSGLVCVNGGCIPDQQARFTCQNDGNLGTLASTCDPASICLHGDCYPSCDVDGGACAAPGQACKSVTIPKGTYDVCGTATNLGSDCNPAVGNYCASPAVCIDGYCR